MDTSLDRDTLVPARKLLALEEELVRKSADYNQDLSRWIAFFLVLVGVCGATAGLLAGYVIARGVSRLIVELYMPIRAASGRLEEVIGPVNVEPAAGIENLDAILRRMADRVGTVVDRLQQNQAKMLRTEQMAALGQLAAGLAHELRNPLTAMKMLIAGAAESSGAPAQLTARDLAVLSAETARLERSIQAFLDFARPPKLQKRSGDVREAVRQTLELVAARGKQQGIRLDADLPQRPVMIEADHEQLRQVLLNLVLNAMDAQPRGGTVLVKLSEAAGDDAARAVGHARRLRPRPGRGRGCGRADFRPLFQHKGNRLGPGACHLPPDRRGPRRRDKHRNVAGRRRRIPRPYAGNGLAATRWYVISRGWPTHYDPSGVGQWRCCLISRWWQCAYHRLIAGNPLGSRCRADIRFPKADSTCRAKRAGCNSQSRNPTSSWLRLGCCSLRTALASIWRIRSRVTLKMWPTSSSV